MGFIFEVLESGGVLDNEAGVEVDEGIVIGVLRDLEVFTDAEAAVVDEVGVHVFTEEVEGVRVGGARAVLVAEVDDGIRVLGFEGREERDEFLDVHGVLSFPLLSL